MKSPSCLDVSSQLTGDILTVLLYLYERVTSRALLALDRFSAFTVVLSSLTLTLTVRIYMKTITIDGCL